MISKLTVMLGLALSVGVAFAVPMDGKAKVVNTVRTAHFGVAELTCDDPRDDAV